MAIRGIDVASYQSETPSLRGMDFCFVKATEGTSYINPKQRAQADWSRKHGRVTGFYHFIRPGSIKAQARYFVAKCASIEGDPLWLDWEDRDVSQSARDEWLHEVLRLRGDTHKVGLYCNTDFWFHRDSNHGGPAQALWIATYNGHPGHPGIRDPWLFHQYTSSPIDTSVSMFASRDALRDWCTDTKSGEHAAAGKEDDMPSAKELVEAIAKTDGVFDVGEKMKRSNPKNKEWQLESILEFIGDGTVDIKDALSALAKRVDAGYAAISELAKALAAHDEAIDVDALIQRIEDRIDSIQATVTLDVADVPKES